jgi:hypothetical protein
MLVAWQMPIAPLSLLGNIIFVPFLVIFLVLASILFFTQLYCLPNAWIAYCLNKVTDWWLTILSLPSGNHVITVPCQSYWMPAGVFIASLFIIHTKFFWKHDVVWVCMLMAIVFLYGFGIVMID